MIFAFSCIFDRKSIFCYSFALFKRKRLEISGIRAIVPVFDSEVNFVEAQTVAESVYPAGAGVESAFLSGARSRPSGQGRPGHIPQST